MAARLTKADFELVIDSIDEAVETFMKWYDKKVDQTASPAAWSDKLRGKFVESLARALLLA